MRIVVCPKNLPLRYGLLLLLLYGLPFLLRAQEDAPSPPKWELGLQSIDMRSILNSNYMSDPVGLKRGAQLYVLRSIGAHMFVRVAAGGTIRRDRQYQAVLDSNHTRTGSSRYTGVAAEVALGTELPRIGRKGLDRLRFRLSIGVSYTDLVRYRDEERTFLGDEVTTSVGRTIRKSPTFQMPIMLQGGYRLLGQLHVGAEWMWGPALITGKETYTDVTNGHPSEYTRLERNRPIFQLATALAFPKIFLSIGF